MAGEKKLKAEIEDELDQDLESLSLGERVDRKFKKLQESGSPDASIVSYMIANLHKPAYNFFAPERFGIFPKNNTLTKDQALQYQAALEKSNIYKQFTSEIRGDGPFSRLHSHFLSELQSQIRSQLQRAVTGETRENRVAIHSSYKDDIFRTPPRPAKEQIDSVFREKR